MAGGELGYEPPTGGRGVESKPGCWVGPQEAGRCEEGGAQEGKLHLPKTHVLTAGLGHLHS